MKRWPDQSAKGFGLAGAGFGWATLSFLASFWESRTIMEHYFVIYQAEPFAGTPTSDEHLQFLACVTWS